MYVYILDQYKLGINIIIVYFCENAYTQAKRNEGREGEREAIRICVDVV